MCKAEENRRYVTTAWELTVFVYFRDILENDECIFEAIESDIVQYRS